VTADDSRVVLAQATEPGARRAIELADLDVVGKLGAVDAKALRRA
jgi:hypothetical protein